MLSFQSEEVSIKDDRSLFPHLDDTFHKFLFLFGEKHLAETDRQLAIDPRFYSICKLDISSDIGIRWNKKGKGTASFQCKRKSDMFAKQSCTNIDLDKNLQ